MKANSTIWIRNVQHRLKKVLTSVRSSAILIFRYPLKKVGLVNTMLLYSPPNISSIHGMGQLSAWMRWFSDS